MQNVFQSPVVGSELAVGNHLVTITGTDTNGNSTQCNFFVQVMEESSNPGCSPYSMSTWVESSGCGAGQYIVHITLNSLGDYESVQIINDVNSNVMNANGAGQIMYGIFNSGQIVNFTATGTNDVSCSNADIIKFENYTIHQVEVYDQYGKLLMNVKIENNQLNLQSLQTGTYILKAVDDNKEMHSVQVIKK